MLVTDNPILALDAVGPSTPTAATRLAAPTATQAFSQRERQLSLPVADRFRAEHDATDQEHLRQVVQGQFVVQPPENHEGNNVRRILGAVQRASAPLIELLFFRCDNGTSDNLEPSDRCAPKRPLSRTKCTSSNPPLGGGGLILRRIPPEQGSRREV